jgi:hypothetical protein
MRDGGSNLREGTKPLFTVVVTMSVVDDPPVTLVGLNPQVETGGHPETVNATVPESGGEKVPIVYDAVPPELMDVELGDAVTPAGEGPPKVKTVLPPHSITLGVAPLHNDASNTVTMK